MGLQVAAQIKAQKEGVCIHYLVDEECLSLAQKAPWVSQIHTLPRKKFQHWLNRSRSSIEDFAEGSQFLTELKKVHFELVLNFFQNPMTAYLSPLLSYGEWRGLQCNRKGELIVKDPAARYLFSIPAARANNPYHAIEVYLQMAGLRPRPPIPFPLKEELMHSLPGESFYALQVGSAWIGKKWPLENFRKLLETLKSPIVLLGSPEEREEALSVSRHLPHVTVLAGQTRLDEILNILSKAELLITGDTFAMHAAAAVNCPTISLFGPSNPIETGPYGSGHLILQSLNELEENLDFNSTERICKISVDDVLRVIRGLAPKNCLVKASRFNSSKVQLEWLSLNGEDSVRNPLKNERDFYHAHLRVHLQQQLHRLLQAQEKTTPLALSEIEFKEHTFYAKHKNQICTECWSLALNALDFNNDLKIYLNERIELTQKWLNDPQELWLNVQTTVHQRISPGSTSTQAPCCSTST